MNGLRAGIGSHPWHPPDAIGKQEPPSALPAAASYVPRRTAQTVTTRGVSFAVKHHRLRATPLVPNKQLPD